MEQSRQLCLARPSASLAPARPGLEPTAGALLPHVRLAAPVRPGRSREPPLEPGRRGGRRGAEEGEGEERAAGGGRARPGAAERHGISPAAE